jgi:coenzyme Q-binding protein COQ10
MPTHRERRSLPYDRSALFDLVADIERYPEFLPWCVACRVKRREGNVILGELMVGFKVFRETFTSRVTLYRPDRIEVQYIDGPFKYLTNTWRFVPLAQGSEIDFDIDFQFSSRLLEAVAGKVFGEAVRRMVGAFESRAHALLGRRSGLAASMPNSL